MKAREFQAQQSRKAVSAVFIYILLLIISLFSGLIVRYMASQLINDFILRTLSIRLLLHGITLSYSSMYSLPVGTTQFFSSFPNSCNWTCVDCNSTIYPFIGRFTSCNCTDGIIAENNLLTNYGTDDLAIVCDNNYIIKNIKPVVLFDGTTPLSMALKINIYLHPKSDIFWSFKDLISDFISSSDFFSREITVFTEMPLNLNDYASTRKLLSETFDYSNLIRISGNNLKINRQGYDNYDSVLYDINRNEGLISIVSKVFELTNNATGEGPLIENKNASFIFNLKPGLKINVSDDKTLCEYECPSQNTLENSCPDYWYKVACFNFSDFEALNCPTCTVGDFNYELDISGCTNNECVGTTSVDYNNFDFVNVVTGTTEPANETITLIPLELVTWNLNTDCSLNLTCTNDNFNINVKKNITKGDDPCANVDSTIQGICDRIDSLTIDYFNGCDSQKDYIFNFVDDFQILSLKDTPSTTFFKSLLSTFKGQTKSVIAEDYKINIFGSCEDPDFKIVLESMRKRNIFSKIGTARAGGITDSVFSLRINKTLGNTVLIQLGGWNP